MYDPLVPILTSYNQLSTMELVESAVWGSKVDGYAYPAAINAPFSEFFGTEVGFHFIISNSNRQLGKASL